MSGPGPFHRKPEDPLHVPPAGPPAAGAPKELYAAMGEEAINRMIGDLYAELEKSSIRAMFPEDMKAAAEKSASFFVFLLGGPPLYHQRHGPPQMRRRHLPFRIDEAARQVWLSCFDKVLTDSDKKYGLPPQHLPAFRTFLQAFSAWMVNSASS